MCILCENCEIYEKMYTLPKKYDKIIEILIKNIYLKVLGRRKDGN